MSNSYNTSSASFRTTLSRATRGSSRVVRAAKRSIGATGLADHANTGNARLRGRVQEAAHARRLARAAQSPSAGGPRSSSACYPRRRRSELGKPL